MPHARFAESVLATYTAGIAALCVTFLVRELSSESACVRTAFIAARKSVAVGFSSQRLPALTSCYGRQTKRHRDALLTIGYALGGEAEYKLCAQLGIVSSADTILRCLKQHTEPEAQSGTKVLGVDDWGDGGAIVTERCW
jgi:hypothetical protein